MQLTVKEISDFYDAHPECIGKLEVSTRYGYKTIEYAGITAYDSFMIKIKTKTQEIITSPNHRLWSEDWIYVKDLSVGTLLLTKNGKEEIVSIEMLKSKEDLYDLQVAEYQEYYANGFVSHNSTFVDAICFGLFGTAYRNINKPQLVNSITRKDCLVEIDFDIGVNSYMVRRGTYPDLFEIHENGKLINQTASVKEYQSFFESTILKMNKKTFCQIVILGTAGYIPFMQLSAYDRREIIEDMLDIQIFTKMNVLLKNKITENKDAVKDIDHSISLLEQKKELIEKNEKLIKRNTEELINDQKDKIIDYDNQISVLVSDIEQLQKDIDANQHYYSSYDKYDAQYLNLINMKKTLENKHKPLHKELQFFKDNDHCPTCTQNIEESFKNLKIESNESKLSDINKGISIASEKSKLLSVTLDSLRKNIDILEEWSDKIKSNNNKIKNLELLKGSARESIRKLEETAPVIDNMEIEDIKNKLSDATALKYKLLETKRLYDIAAVLLKDSGIKTKITKQYIPVINKLINKYLASLDFFVNFELNEQFKEKIKSRFRDDFSYESFSEGEKTKIDLALMFTWRAVAKLRNSTSTNLLIMDEVFDSSLDVNGTDELLKLMYEITSDTNLFIISHKSDHLVDKFHNIIRFEKVKNFSRIAA